MRVAFSQEMDRELRMRVASAILLLPHVALGTPGTWPDRRRRFPLPTVPRAAAPPRRRSIGPARRRLPRDAHVAGHRAVRFRYPELPRPLRARTRWYPWRWP